MDLVRLEPSEWMTWHFRFVLNFINMVTAKDVRLGQTLACLCQTFLHVTSIWNRQQMLVHHADRPRTSPSTPTSYSINEHIIIKVVTARMCASDSINGVVILARPLTLQSR
eukprot:4924400-Amphidinium_carterae.1